MPSARVAPRLELVSGAAERYAAVQPTYRARLTAPQDDMWATFADLAEPWELRFDGETAGCASVDGRRQLLFLHLLPEFESDFEGLLPELVRRLDLAAIVAGTNDPDLFQRALDLAAPAEVRAILYRLEREPDAHLLTGLRDARPDDHEAAVAFAEAAVGGPRSFLECYLAARIGRGELRLLEEDGAIVATGERRRDARFEGHAHLGVIVSEAARGRGLASRMLSTLVHECRDRGLLSLASTEPSNHPARRALRRAGLVARHRIVRFAVGGAS